MPTPLLLFSLQDLHGLWDSLHYEPDEDPDDEGSLGDASGTCTSDISSSGSCCRSPGRAGAGGAGQGGSAAATAAGRGGGKGGRISAAAAAVAGGRGSGGAAAEGSPVGGGTGGGGGSVKKRLLSYAGSALLFSECGVDKSLVSWNRVVRGGRGHGGEGACASVTIAPPSLFCSAPMAGRVLVPR